MPLLFLSAPFGVLGGHARVGQTRHVKLRQAREAGGGGGADVELRITARHPVPCGNARVPCDGFGAALPAVHVEAATVESVRADDLLEGLLGGATVALPVIRLGTARPIDQTPSEEHPAGMLRQLELPGAGDRGRLASTCRLVHRRSPNRHEQYAAGSAFHGLTHCFLLTETSEWGPYRDSVSWQAELCMPERTWPSGGALKWTSG